MIWGEKVLIFRYNFGMCLVFVVGEVRKKSVPFFCGGVAVDLMWSYHSRENCNFSPWSGTWVGTLARVMVFAFD
jgi:hypothetical protein